MTAPPSRNAIAKAALYLKRRSDKAAMIPRRKRSRLREWLVRLRLREPEPSTSQSLLPVLMRVFAGFSKIDGTVIEAEIDSSLNFMRYDYPDAVYTELRDVYLKALAQPQDLNQMAADLANRLTMEEKILLGVQLYVLISRSAAGGNKIQLVSFYQFMTNLGIGAQAIDIVYQLNAEDIGAPRALDTQDQPLESIAIGRDQPADLALPSIPDKASLVAFRFQRLILIKNSGRLPIIVRGRQVPPGEFSRLYPGQRVVMGEVVFRYADLEFYFSAKKNVSGTELFLTLGEQGGVIIDRNRGRQSHLQVRFGLGVTVRALRDTEAHIGGRLLKRDVSVETTQEDILLLSDETEVRLSDIQRRARDLGGQFRLQPSKTVYLVSNSPQSLHEGDILLSPTTPGEVLLRIGCNYAQKTGTLEVLKAERPVFVGRTPVRFRADLRDGDTITIGEGQFLRCHFGDRIIEEQRNVVRRLETRSLTHRYDRRNTALDGVSIHARRGEMICVMGPSGCGKSTLLRVLAGQLRPTEGEARINGLSLFDNLDRLRPYIASIPQEDAFDPLLTIEENMHFSAAIRCPHLSQRVRQQRADARLQELGLSELRGRLAGTAETKHLSGGERKRLNAGLDMVSIADVFLFDEPTSGLSSKDSEHVLEIIRSLAQNKIILVSIHQPSSRLFRMFDKALLLDRGGSVAYFGTPQGMLDYFWRAHQEHLLAETSPAVGPSTPDNLAPDFIFDVLETPLRDLSGDTIYEQGARGHMVPARRFPPEFWKHRLDTIGVLEEVSQIGERPSEETEPPAHLRPIPDPPHRGLREEGVHLVTTVKRAFLSKMRNRANLFTTLLEAPALAALIAVVLRHSEDGDYTFAAAFHIPVFLFLGLVVAMFLGLTNSAGDVVRDRPLLNRELNERVRPSFYVLAKFSSLGVFALIQCILFVAIGNAILGVRDMFWHYLLWTYMTSLVGVSLGLFVSSLVADPKTALNIIPLILIPQIILGGALIKYEEMNRNLDFVYSITRWVESEQSVPETGVPLPPSSLRVPFICEFMPLRWSYEALVISQFNLNPVTQTQNQLQDQIEKLIDLPEGADLTDDEFERLEQVKQALAIVSGLEADDPRGVVRKLRELRRQLRQDRFDPEAFQTERRDDPVTAEELFVNQKVRDLVTKAELERVDYRRQPGTIDGSPTPQRKPVTTDNVFFGTRKVYFGHEVGTLAANALAMVVFIGLFLVLLHQILRRQLTRT